MNSCIRNNWKVFNVVHFVPIDIEKPNDLKDINEWTERTWKHLVDDELTRHKFFCVKGKRGYTISVWSDKENLYVISCVRTENNTDDTLIYGIKLTENNLNDFIAIAKFMRYNSKAIIGHSQKAIHELNKMVKAMEIQKEFESKHEEA